MKRKRQDSYQFGTPSAAAERVEKENRDGTSEESHRREGDTGAAAEISEGDPRSIFLASVMNWPWKTPPGGAIVTDGSAWM
jgi:hypothetical protein